jgi:hypothetical protein
MNLIGKRGNSPASLLQLRAAQFVSAKRRALSYNGHESVDTELCPRVLFCFGVLIFVLAISF